MYRQSGDLPVSPPDFSVPKGYGGSLFPPGRPEPAPEREQLPDRTENRTPPGEAVPPGEEPPIRVAFSGDAAPSSPPPSSDATPAGNVAAPVFSHASESGKTPPFGGLLGRLPFLSSFGGKKSDRFDPTLLLLIWLVMEGGRGAGVLPYLFALLLIPE